MPGDLTVDFKEFARQVLVGRMLPKGPQNSALLPESQTPPPPFLGRYLNSKSAAKLQKTKSREQASGRWAFAGEGGGWGEGVNFDAW